MHIYFSGIGGAGIGPLAEIARDAGYQVSGSDKQDSSYLRALIKSGIRDIAIDQSYEHIAQVHAKQPIDWLVFSSAVLLEQTDSPELKFAKEQQIKVSKRDELINRILSDQKLDLIAIAGTHGKTTTTAMVVWLCQQLGLPISYLLPAKTSFAEMGHYQPGSRFFIIEADEFDRNFLNFEPWLSLISGVSWDHHEIFPTRENYQQAFIDFIKQSRHTISWLDDALYLGIDNQPDLTILDPANKSLTGINLLGFYNRLDAWLAIQAVKHMSDAPLEKLIEAINRFPGLSRRMEQVRPNLYSDYAHTPEKIRGVMSVAQEMAKDSGQSIVVVYEPLTNRRQHYLLNEYGDCFAAASQVYWLPSYLAREDPKQRILPPAELIARLSDPTVAVPAQRDEGLKRTIDSHLKKGDMVVCIAGGGGGSLDDWIRDNF